MPDILNGSAVLIAINKGTTESPDFEVVPCQTSGEYSLTVATRDTSCKDSADNSNLPAARDRSLSCEILVDAWPLLQENPTTAAGLLRKCAETGVQVEVQIQVSGTGMEQGVATITSYSLALPREDNVSNSLELQLSGGLTPVDESS